MNCPKCNAPNNDSNSFCADCGTPLPKITEAQTIYQSAITCPKCNSSNKATNTFCADCGTSLRQPVNVPVNSIPTTPSNIPSAKICPVCNASNSARNTFCADCGNSLQTPVNVPPPTPVPNQPPANVQPQFNQPIQPLNQPTPQQPPQEQMRVPINNPEVVEQRIEAEPPPKKKRSKALFWVMTLLLLPLLLLGIALAVVYFIPKQGDRAYAVSDKHGDNKALHLDEKGTVLLAGIANDEYQKWQITPDLEYEDSYRFINWGQGDDQSFQVVDDASDDKVSMAESADDDGQLWAITNVEGDFYRITNNWVGDSKALTHFKKYYYFLRMRDSSNKEGQMWKKVPAPNGNFYLINMRYGNDKGLEAIYSGKFVDKVFVNDKGNYGNMQWVIKSVGNGYFTLTTASHVNDKKNKSLDVNPDKKDRVRMANSGNFSGQKWKLTPVGNDYFRLTNEFLGEGKSLEAVTYSRFELKMQKVSDDPGQRWRLERVSK